MRLGVIGGMGPASTAYFYSLITDMTEAPADQQHLEIVIYSKPQIPDRTAYILGRSDESPLPALAEAARALEAFGVSYIAVPCVTAHHFYDGISRAVRTPVVNILTATQEHLMSLKIGRVGLLATDGTVASGAFSGLLRSGGIDVLLPSAEEQAGIMNAIYSCKANLPPDRSGIVSAAGRMRECGAEALLLACTELSLINREVRLDGAVDMLEVLARRCIELCGATPR